MISAWSHGRISRIATHSLIDLTSRIYRMCVDTVDVLSRGLSLRNKLRWHGQLARIQIRVRAILAHEPYIYIPSADDESVNFLEPRSEKEATPNQVYPRYLRAVRRQLNASQYVDHMSC